MSKELELNTEKVNLTKHDNDMEMIRVLSNVFKETRINTTDKTRHTNKLIIKKGSTKDNIEVFYSIELE